MRYLECGMTIKWHIRPEVHVDHGGYLTGEKLMGRIISVHEKHVMVRQDNSQRELQHIISCPDFVLAVDKNNPSIEIVKEE